MILKKAIKFSLMKSEKKQMKKKINKMITIKKGKDRKKIFSQSMPNQTMIYK